ncbi:hypothetical protein TNCV_2318761 [Trichonephila clavipes]|nr:hypothetical protein TNCV_2318761 [Trichonephila clavipes]
MGVIQVDDSSETSDNMQMSFENEASDNTTSDEVDDSSNDLHAENEVLDNLASDSMSSNNLHADNIEVDSDILYAHASDNIQLDNMQSSSDNMTSDSLHVTSDNMASDSLYVTSDNMASDTMAQIEDERNLYKGKLILAGRSMPSKIRVVPQFASTWLKRSLFG